MASRTRAPGDLEVHQAWVRPTAQGENAAVYLTLHNHSANADELTGATTTVADMVEIHESKMENDVMQMSMVTSLPIAADEEIIFTPGGYHIMLVNIKEELVLGEHIGLVLHFKTTRILWSKSILKTPYQKMITRRTQTTKQLMLR